MHLCMSVCVCVYVYVSIKYLYFQMTFNTNVKTIQWGKNSLQKSVPRQLYIYVEKNIVGPSLHACILGVWSSSNISSLYGL